MRENAHYDYITFLILHDNWCGQEETNTPNRLSGFENGFYGSQVNFSGISKLKLQLQGKVLIEKSRTGTSMRKKYFPRNVNETEIPKKYFGILN